MLWSGTAVIPSSSINIVLYKNANLGFNGSLNSGLTVGKNVRYNGAFDLNYRKGKVNLFDGSTSSRTLIYFEEILDSENPYETEIENYTGTYNLSYKHDFNKEGHNIEFEGSHALTDQFEEGAYSQVMNPIDLTSNYTEDIHNEVTGTILNLDYTNPISENAKLEVGLETRFRDTMNLKNTTQHQFVYDDNNMPISDGDDWFLTTGVGGSAFSYNRNIYSAYTNYNQKIGKFSMQIGLRAEQYEVDAIFDQGEETESYREEKFTLYPSAFFTYAPGEKNQFQLSYSRRVDRPSINQVNPIRSWSTPLLTMVGNPGLKPQFTDSYEINYTRRLKKGSVSLGTFFRRINDNIIRYASTDPFDENKVVLTFVNADYEDRYGVEMSGMYRPTGWWNINASFDLYSQQMSGYAFGEYVETGSISTNVRMNNSFKATENLSFQLFGMYRGRKEIIQWIIQPMWMVNAGASLKVLRRKGTISVRVNDIFNTMNFEFESTNFYPSTGGFFWESRTAYVGLAYNFGQGSFKAMKRRSRDSNEFQGSGGF